MNDLQKKYYDIFYRDFGEFGRSAFDVSFIPCFDQSGNFYVIKRSATHKPSEYRFVHHYLLIPVEDAGSVVEAFPFPDGGGIFFLLTGGTLVVVSPETKRIIITNNVKKIFSSGISITTEDRIVLIEHVIPRERIYPYLSTILPPTDDINKLVIKKHLAYVLLNDGRLFICGVEIRELFPGIKFQDLEDVFFEDEIYDDYEFCLLGMDSVVYHLGSYDSYKRFQARQVQRSGIFWFDRLENNKFPHTIDKSSIERTKNYPGGYPIDKTLILHEYRTEELDNDGRVIVEGLYEVFKIKQVGNRTIVLKLDGELWISKAETDVRGNSEKVYTKLDIPIKDFITSGNNIYVFDYGGRVYVLDRMNQLEDTNLPPDIHLSPTNPRT